MKKVCSCIMIGMVLVLALGQGCFWGQKSCLPITPSVSASENASADAVTEEPKGKPLVFTRKVNRLKAGESYTFAVKGGIAGESVRFRVSNSKVAVISQKGKLRAKRIGTVTVTAKSGDYSVKAKVKITPKKIVALDPGHSGKLTGGTEPVGPGAKTKKAKDVSGTQGVVTKVPEYKLTLILAKKMKVLLEERGYQVVMTREDNNTAISCAQRAKIANKAKADIFIRIHADGIQSSSVSGASALYPTTKNPYVGKWSGKSKKLSECVLNSMCKKSGAKNRGLVGRDDLSGSNWAQMPVTLIEVGFMTNPEEDRKLNTKEYQNKLAQGMVDGIETYFGY